MAPLTRCRATPEGVPTPAMAKHYGDRATAGLIVSEATLVSPHGRGFPRTPGLWSAEQAAAWKPVVAAVHARGGRIFAQLWHQGRTAYKPLLPEGSTPVGPSAVPFMGGFGSPCEAPRELATGEVRAIVEEYAAAAAHALDAGFDGVELHAANGYLPNQFLCDGSNKRTDEYGGPIANRVRFPLEVMAALVRVCGAERVGVRVSPASHWQDMHDSDPQALYAHFARELARLGPLAYLHVVEPRDTGMGAATDPVDVAMTSSWLRQFFPGTILSAGGHDYASGAAYLADGSADAIVYGRHYTSNPDLVARFAAGPETPLNPYDRATFYTHEEEGYNTWPTMEQQAQAGSSKQA